MAASVRVRIQFEMTDYNANLTKDQLEAAILREFVYDWADVLGDSPDSVVVEVL